LKVEKQLCHHCEKAVYANEGKVVDGHVMHPNCASKYWQKQAEEQRARTRLDKSPLLQSIETRADQPLRHVDTNDKSQPNVEAVPVRKNIHSNVMEQVQKVELKELKHVETVDKGAPVIDKKTKVKKSSHPKVMNEIKEFKGFAEKKAEYEERAQAQFDKRDKVLSEIPAEHNLKHVENVHDTSNPQVEAIPLRKNNRKEVNKEIEDIEHRQLKHVDTVDKAQPDIVKGTKVKKDVLRPKLLGEIQEGPRLKDKKTAYVQQTEEAQKLDSTFHNREGSDLNSLSGVAKNKRAAYEESVQNAQKLPDGLHGKEGQDARQLEHGLTQKVKSQYQQGVEASNQEKESTRIEKEGDKVVYKNLPPKKDLNELI